MAVENGTSLTVHGPDANVLVADGFGDPSAAPIVLSHGGGQTRHSWRHAARALGDRGWYAVCYDLRGHGDSDWIASGDYSAEALARDLREVSRCLPAKPVLVGASLGGIASLLLEGAVAPGTAAALVLVDIAPRIEPDGTDRIRDFMLSHPDGFESVEQAADAVAGYSVHRPRPSDLSGLERNLRPRGDGRMRWHWDPNVLNGRTRLDLADYDKKLSAAARNLAVPTLLVRGAHSDILSEQGVEEFLQLVPHARYADVRGAGHMVVGDRNDVFLGAVTEFLDSVELA